MSEFEIGQHVTTPGTAGMGTILKRNGKVYGVQWGDFQLPTLHHEDTLRLVVSSADIDGPAKPATDAVNYPSHYTRFPGVEVIQITEHLNFCRGNAVKYIARAGAKDSSAEIQDLEKARWYIDREIERLRK
jgi:hypothetical protein